MPGTQEVLHKHLLLLLFFTGRLLAFGIPVFSARQCGEYLPGVGRPVNPGPAESHLNLMTTFGEVGTIIRPVFKAVEQPVGCHVPTGKKLVQDPPALGIEGWMYGIGGFIIGLSRAWGSLRSWEQLLFL